MAQAEKNIGDILVEEGILSREELEEVLEKSRTRDLSLEETLFKLGYISRDRLGGLLAKLYSCEFIDLYSSRIESNALNAVPAEEALRLHALPFTIEGDTLVVALSGPFSTTPFEEIVSELEWISGKKIRVAMCNPDPLKEMLLRFYKSDARETRTVAPKKEELASMIKSVKFDKVETGLRGQFEELYDVGQTALIGARSHPFSRAVSTAIEEAKTKLADARKYAESGFEEEGVEMAQQAINIIKEATARASSFERDWDKLLQQVKGLRSRIGGLEKEGAEDFAPTEFQELIQIREGLMECVNERNVEKLRSLLDQGMVLAEKVSLLSPGKTRGREQVIASLAQVREVIARARKVGAKEHAPDAVKEAYEFLDRAESYARQAQWEEVKECLQFAESKAVEAERIALRVEEEREQLSMKLRDAVRSATVVLEEAMTHRFAHEVIENIMRVKDIISEAKACFESNEYERGIDIAKEVTESIKIEILPQADEAERTWNELSRRANEVSERIQSLDVVVGLKISPEKVAFLFKAQRDMIEALCARERGKLTDTVSLCESLSGEILQSIAEARENLHRAENEIEGAMQSLASAADSGVDMEVADAYQQARSLLEEARSSYEKGDAETASKHAKDARDRLELEVIEPQSLMREEWNQLIPRVSETIQRIDTASTADAMFYCSELVEALRGHASEVFSAFTTRDAKKMVSAIEMAEGTLESISPQVEIAKEDRHRELSEQLSEIEETVQTAVERCSGSYAPDMLEGAYGDLNRIKEQLASGPQALNERTETALTRDLAVARTKVWQVEFLRERFEEEREADLKQLRKKIEAAHETITAAAGMDFIGESHPLVQKAREQLRQVDNLLVEGEVEESFAVVRQAAGMEEQIRAASEDRGQEWRELVNALLAEGASCQEILSDPVAERIAGEDRRRLSDLAAQAQSIMDSKNHDALKAHIEELRNLARSMTDRIERAREREHRWNKLMETLNEGEASRQETLSDSEAQQVAADQYGSLVGLVEQTSSIIDSNDTDALEEHIDTLEGLTREIRERVETFQRESRNRVSDKLGTVEQEMRLAEMFKGNEICPDVMNAARTHLEIAQSYLNDNSFSRAESAAGDALAKAQEASSLARAGSQRAGDLALDYMKMASSLIEQEKSDAAKDALGKGIELAEQARLSQDKPEE